MTLRVIAYMLVAAFASQACAEEPKVPPTINDVKARHADELMDVPGVVSVGIGLDEDGEKIIVVGVERDQPEVRQATPSTLEGYKVQIQVVGKYTAK